MNTERRKQPAANDHAEQPGRPRTVGEGRHSSGAEVILIPKQLRVEWVDVMAHDTRLGLVALKVALIIGSHFNRHTGDTYLSQETIADAAGLSLRAVRNGIVELEARGYLIVRRRELGPRKSDGRRVCGGRGVANVYLPAFERAQVAATNAGRRLAERVDEAWRRVHDRRSARRIKEAPACLHSETEGGTGVPPLTDGAENERRHETAEKVAPACLPTLGNPTDYNPVRGRAAARKDATAHPLGAAFEELERRLGSAPARTWFDRVTIESEKAGTLVLAAPSRFMRDYLAGRHEADVLNAWNSTRPRGSPLVDRVDFVVVRK
jgi:hypothetical protein